MSPKPSIHHFKPNFKPLGFIRPRWQAVHNALFRPGRFSRFTLNNFRNMLQKNRISPPKPNLE